MTAASNGVVSIWSGLQPSLYISVTSLIAVVILATLWNATRLGSQPLYQSKVPIVGVPSGKLFQNVSAKLEYIRTGWWSIHEGYQKVGQLICDPSLLLLKIVYSIPIIHLECSRARI